jgi:hypothetical protein
VKEKTYYDITKEYPLMYRVILYKSPYTPKPPKEKTMSKMSFSSFQESQEYSIRRTRRTLHDLVKCNDFDLFVTFTFNPKKIDRYDLVGVTAKMQGWLRRQYARNNNFQYLIVPEKHKDGAIHFHALMKDYPFVLKRTNVIQDNRRVYNIPMFKFGFTNATYLPRDDREKVGNYIAKYISKDMITMPNRRRYWASRNLKKPITRYNSIYETGMHQHLDFNTQVSESAYNTIFEVNKDLFDK